jgi:predicted nuclease of restriction endonuclease-like (RecB) superfamily
MVELAFADYEEFLRDVKQRIDRARVRASLAVNQELVMLYWHLGREILLRQRQQGWGSQVVNRLARDLQQAFPTMGGLSARNLHYMRSLAEAYPDEQIVQQVVAQIPWGHNVRILDAAKTTEERLWYVQQTVEHGWSRKTLTYHLDSKLYQRRGGAITNFDRALPAPQSELARDMLKDPYTFDFLDLVEAAQERDIERALVDRIRDFLLELGVGFAFLGSQYPLQVSGKDYRLDLLFYHVRLHCYVVVDLKVTEFEPEFSGKMNFYISAVDDLLRQPEDQPTIGIILCRTKDRTIVEYALRDLNKPIGVSTYQLRDVLPESLQGSLPTIAELEGTLHSLPLTPEDRR